MYIITVQCTVPYTVNEAMTDCFNRTPRPRKILDHRTQNNSLYKPSVQHYGVAERLQPSDQTHSRLMRVRMLLLGRL